MSIDTVGTCDVCQKRSGRPYAFHYGDILDQRYSSHFSGLGLHLTRETEYRFAGKGCATVCRRCLYFEASRLLWWPALTVLLILLVALAHELASPGQQHWLEAHDPALLLPLFFSLLVWLLSVVLGLWGHWWEPGARAAIRAKRDEICSARGQDFGVFMTPGQYRRVHSGPPGSDGVRTAFQNAFPGFGRLGQDLHYQVEITAAEALTGTSKAIVVNFADRCPRCDGSGAVCETGRRSRACPECDRSGETWRERRLTVKIPPAPESGWEGSTLRLAGQGKAAGEGFANGDLMLTVRVVGSSDDGGPNASI